MAQYPKIVQLSSSVEGPDPASVVLSLSRRLIDFNKVKNILNIEAGLEMVALAMAITAEVFVIQNIQNPLIHWLFIRIMGYFRNKLLTSDPS